MTNVLTKIQHAFSFRPNIGPRLGVVFVIVGLLMALGDAVALIQIDGIRRRAEFVYQADQPSQAVLLVRSSFLSYQDRLRQLAEAHNADHFVAQSETVRSAFDAYVDEAIAAVRTLPVGPERDGELNSLDSVRTLFDAQIKSLNALAVSGDWASVQSRLENRMAVINELSSGLVQDINSLVNLEKSTSLKEIRGTQLSAIYFLIIASAVTLTLASYLGLRATRDIAGRLKILDEAAQALSEGDFDQRVIVAGHDEVARLSRVFNEMSARLQTMYRTLHQSETRFRSLIENASDFILVVTKNGTIKYASPSMTRIFAAGMLTEGKNLLEYLDEQDRAAMDSFLGADAGSVELSDTVEFRLRDRKGGLRIIEASGNDRTEDQGIEGFVINARDVTDRKKAEEGIANWKRRYDAAVLATGQIIYEADLSDGTAAFGGALEAVLGYCQQDLKSGLESWHALIHPEDLVRYLAVIEEAQKGQLPFAVEYRVRRKDASFRIVKESGLIHGNSGNTQHIVASIIDVTEHRALEERLQQSQKMEAVGRLAGGLAHDFNNLLMITRAGAQLLMDSKGDAGRVNQLAQQIDEATERGANLTKQLLAFTRQQVLQPTRLNLNTVVQDLWRILPPLLGEDIDTELSLDPELGPVNADQGKLEQVIMNLALNARDAMPNGGHLRVETCNVSIDEKTAKLEDLDITPGPYVCLLVSDNGIGISPEIRQHIFDPFFTTKGLGYGTGLGLATVYGIVKQSDGAIAVYSEVGIGTTFKIYLRRLDQSEGESRPKEVVGEAPTGFGTILLVEDEDALRGLAAEYLRAKGYEVLEARSAKEAIEVSGVHEGRIHVLVTDVVMPGSTSGPALAERMRSSRPYIRVILMSGYTHQPAELQLHDPAVVFFQKPFSLEVLARKINDMVGQSMSLDHPR